MQNLILFLGWMLAIVVGLFAFAILFKIVAGEIKLEYLISETNGQASMARFQFLVFTFVIAVSLFLVILTKGDFPEVPGGILTLLGISGGSYVVGKGIQASATKPAPPPPGPNPQKHANG
jgi:hypothetical protein